LGDLIQPRVTSEKKPETEDGGWLVVVVFFSAYLFILMYWYCQD